MIRNTKTQTGRSFRLDGAPLLEAAGESRRAIRRIARNLSSAPDRERRRTGRARLLTVEQIRRVVTYLRETSRVPESAVLKVYLSFYAGLRASEIAALTVHDVMGADGRLADYISVPASIEKTRRGRKVPMHPLIAEALETFLKAFPDAEHLAISSRRGRRQSREAVKVWLRDIYRRLGYVGCSSHSGRRFYITELARRAGQHGLSLVDVQRIAGHSQLSSTECYIEPSSENLHAMVASLGHLPDEDSARAPLKPPLSHNSWAMRQGGGR